MKTTVVQPADRNVAGAVENARTAKRYSFKAVAVAAALALALGAAPLAACSSTSSASGSSASASETSASTESTASEEASSASSESAASGEAASEGSQAAGSASGEAPDASGSGGSAPSEGGTPPDMPSGESSMGGQPGGAGGGANTQTFDYTGDYTGALEADGEEVVSSGETITATESDQNAALAMNGGTLNVSNATLEKSGDDTDGDRCNFYGANSIVLAVNEGSTAIVSDSTLTAESEGSNALFATDSATLYANNVTVATSADNSRGLDATYGGTIVASGLDITTQGDHCASVATDRGGGYISVSDSTLSTAGSGSPILYSTGCIEVDGVEGVATGSQLVGMEGLNTIMISNSTLTSKQTGKTASDPIADGIIIYQSTSGDADTSTGETALFQASDSTLSSAIESGAMFYLTNTQAKVVLSNTVLDFDSDAAKLIVAAGNDSNNWGSAGSNGATVTFTGIQQELAGDVEVDTISSVDFYLLDGSSWTGAASIVENGTATTSTDHLNVSIDATSTWVVTADSTVTNLSIASGGSLVDESGNAVKVADSDGNVLVEGASSITVTVTDDFTTSVSTSNANKLEDASIDRSGFEALFGADEAAE